ncbi:MAG: hypothetical protein KGI75_01265 [Rhizobiaceae bacterium]|nr:hypothetical protein [Rhizobiaceae bacterium]
MRKANPLLPTVCVIAIPAFTHTLVRVVADFCSVSDFTSRCPGALAYLRQFAPNLSSVTHPITVGSALSAKTASGGSGGDAAHMRRPVETLRGELHVMHMQE